MTKEEYLEKYKEKLLAEICENYEKAIKSYKAQMLQSDLKIGSLKKEISELKDTAVDLTDMNKLFDKLKILPAENFLKLYYKMHKLVNTGRTEECLTISNNYATIGSAISAS